MTPTPIFECPYYPDRQARYLVALLPEGSDSPPELVDEINNSGLRRAERMVYRPDCPSCAHCVPYRVATGLPPTRNMRRILKNNADVVVDFHALDPTPEKARLYIDYNRIQHHARPAFSALTEEFDARSALDTMLRQMYAYSFHSLEAEYRLDGHLIGFGVLDIGISTISSVYFAWDPKYAARSPGILSILLEILWARERGFDHYHLGYHLAGHPKMDYKARFKPAEILDHRDRRWKNADQ